jgi:hypothetical protein
MRGCAERSPRVVVLLRSSAVTQAAAPSRDAAYLVFAQLRDARIDIDAWNDYAVRFFGARVGLAQPPDRQPGGDARSAAARVIVAADGAVPGIRGLSARPRDDVDMALAEAADAKAGHPGLALLARRCDIVWLVERDEEPDRTALLCAAILAGVMLGPILDARVPEIFGVKTARAKLEAIQIIKS